MSTLTLKEYIQVDSLCEAWNTEFTDDQIESAEYFNIKYNAVSGKYMLVLYDVQGEPIGSVEYDDVDLMMAFIEEYFDLGEDDSVEVEIDGDDENVMYIATSRYGMGADYSDGSSAAAQATTDSRFGAMQSSGDQNLGAADID